jgi:hypothetical protein
MGLLGSEESFAVVGTEEEHEPVQVGLQLWDAVAGVSDELGQGRGAVFAVAGEPVVEELQQLAELSRVTGVEADGLPDAEKSTLRHVCPGRDVVLGRGLQRGVPELRPDLRRSA